MGFPRRTAIAFRAIEHSLAAVTDHAGEVSLAQITSSTPACLAACVSYGPRSRENPRAAVWRIETIGGRLTAIRLRPWPKLLALPELIPLDPRYHAAGAADRCLLYYNQPRRMPNYLALKYIVSTSGTSYATFRAALHVLDAVAAVKEIDAIVCDAANVRLSDRLMRRFGWEPHKPQACTAITSAVSTANIRRWRANLSLGGRGSRQASIRIPQVGSAGASPSQCR